MIKLAELDVLLQACLAENRVDDGITAITQCDDRRFLIWWACLCGWATWRPTPSPPQDLALQLASRWADAPSEEARREAGAAVVAPGRAARDLLLKAVLYSGGSISGSDQPAVEPPAEVCGKFTFAFLHSLLSTRPPTERPQHAQHFVELGRQTLATAVMPAASA